MPPLHPNQGQRCGGSRAAPTLPAPGQLLPSTDFFPAKDRDGSYAPCSSGRLALALRGLGWYVQ